MRELYCTGASQWLPPLQTLWPGLRRLEVNSWPDLASTSLPGWLAQLQELAHLQHLEFPVPGSGFDKEPLDVPSLTGLTSLRIGGRIGGRGRARVDLSKLPSLEKLVFSGYGHATIGGAQAGPGPCRLRELKLRTVTATVDFRHMDALRSAWLEEGVEDATGLSAATALQVLRLGGEHGWMYPDDFDLRQPWVLEALRHAPPSLRLLTLYGDWGEEAVEAMLDLGQLRALSLSGPGGEDSGEPPSARLAGEGRLWRSLRALRWECYSRLPEEIAQATQLEVLHWSNENGSEPTMEEMSPFLYLPALRRLGFLCDIACPAELREQLDSARQLRGMPPLEALHTEWLHENAFIEDVMPLLE